VYFVNINNFSGIILSSISLLISNKFSSKVQSWAARMAIEVHAVNDKTADFFESTDSLLIFNQNQELSPEILELKARYDKQQKPVHKIDINGTLQVGITNLALWLDSTKSKNMFVIGAEELADNLNLERYLDAI
jgi:ABC-type transport system involved in cytochrome bd biosynthesis fused ATPase/permease subunit